jgi:hypothetical protein
MPAFCLPCFVSAASPAAPAFLSLLVREHSWKQRRSVTLGKDFFQEFDPWPEKFDFSRIVRQACDSFVTAAAPGELKFEKW